MANTAKHQIPPHKAPPSSSQVAQSHAPAAKPMSPKGMQPPHQEHKGTDTSIAPTDRYS